MVGTPTRTRSALARDWLPVGGTLPDAAFEARHRAVVWLLWLHVLALPAFAVARGYPLRHGLLDVLPVVLCAAGATAHRFDRRGRASLGALGLVTCSAVFTHLWGGVTEAHFHFFVVVALLSLYEDWVPWGLACGYVLVHHGIMGVLDPKSVYGAHADAAQHPLQWALIHAGFISALAGVNLVSWRSNESARVEAGASADRFRHELLWQAHHDPLTGLPNRRAFVQRIDDALERCASSPAGAAAHVAVLFVDVDDFKVVNDSLGHAAGDRLLEAVAQRLSSAVRPQDVIARFGGDEFSILLPGVTGEHQALKVVERLADALRAPIDLDGEARFITASVGVALARDRDRGRDRDREATYAASLLQDADAAMYRAKELGKDRCEVFDDSMRARAVERLELESALREAPGRGQLYLDYQPQVALPGGAVVGVEALLRWRHPRLGTVAPGVFVPIAERTGQIVEIGAWVLHEACTQAMRWDSDTLEIAVNVSARQLEDGEFADVVRSVLARTGVPPRRLCLEVTETALLADADGARAMLAELKAIGVRVAVDDFGVGHASLRHLRQLLPVDTLKIDKSFVDGVVDDPEDAAIVEAVVRLAAGLGLECVAEGVEHAAQAEVLADIGCHAAQGFHFARPMAPDAVAGLLAAATL